jgi:PhnB protein
MARAAKPIPEGFHTITPHLVIRNAARAIDFYKTAFGAESAGCAMTGPDGKTIMHAELKIGDSRFMLCEEYPDMGVRSPQAIGGTPVALHLYVNDVDAAYNRAVQAGAKPQMPPKDMFWGDRFGKVVDPFGHEWSLATHVQDLTPEQMKAAASQAFAQGCK